MASQDSFTNMLLQGGVDEQVDAQYQGAPSRTGPFGLTGYPWIGALGVHGWTPHGLVPLPPRPTQVPIMSAHTMHNSLPVDSAGSSEQMPMTMTAHTNFQVSGGAGHGAHFAGDGVLAVSVDTPKAGKRPATTRQSGQGKGRGKTGTTTRKRGCTTPTQDNASTTIEDPGQTIPETSDQEQVLEASNKGCRGATWSEHHIINLCHIRGEMHKDFLAQPKQGQDKWSKVLTRLRGVCPTFDKDAQACRPKWKQIYNDYKSDCAKNVSEAARQDKCAYFDVIHLYMHDWPHVQCAAHVDAGGENAHSGGPSDSTEPTCSQAQGSQSSGNARKPSNVAAKAIKSMEKMYNQGNHFMNTVKGIEDKRLSFIEIMATRMSLLTNVVVSHFGTQNRSPPASHDNAGAC